MIVFLLITILCIVLFIVTYKKFKFPKCGNLVVTTGGVKSGKSTFSFALAYKTYKRNLRLVKFYNFFAKIFSKPLREKPLFYTSIPVVVPHVLLTDELLKREKRFAFKSVIWVDEASIVADSQSYKVRSLNDKLLMFNKLIAHCTHGGSLFYNTQSIADLHYSIKRSISEVFYVHETFKWIPFFLIVTVREERYSEDGLAINVYDRDLEESLKRVIIPKSVWKKFDCYAFSKLTDDLPVVTNLNKNTSLKATSIVSFNERYQKMFADLDKGDEK